MKQQQITTEHMAGILKVFKAGQTIDDISPALARLIPKTILLLTIHTIVVIGAYLAAKASEEDLLTGFAHILLISLFIRIGGSINNIKWVNFTRKNANRTYQAILPLVDWQKVEEKLTR